MTRQRRLRRLVPDGELIRRRATGEPLRALARDYGVSHTTLARYFARPQVVRRLGQAVRAVRAEQRAAAARRRRLEREVRTEAGRQAAAERRRVRRAAPGRAAGGRPAARGGYAAWLDGRDAAVPLSRTDLSSRNDDRAARVVAAHGGMQAVIEATGLRTRENALRLLDPAILVRALDNDAAPAAADPAD